MTDVQQSVPVEEAEQMPELKEKLKAAIINYKKASTLEQQKAAISGIADIYMELIGKKPTDTSMQRARELLASLMVEATGDAAERSEHPNSWPNVHAKLSLYARVMEEVIKRLLNGTTPEETSIPEETATQDAAKGISDDLHKRVTETMQP